MKNRDIWVFLVFMQIDRDTEQYICGYLKNQDAVNWIRSRSDDGEKYFICETRIIGDENDD